MDFGLFSWMDGWMLYHVMDRRTYSHSLETHRAIYFASYSQGKHVYSKLTSDQKETPGVHMLSAASAGTVTGLFTNPIWVAKTRVVGIPASVLSGIRPLNGIGMA